MKGPLFLKKIIFIPCIAVLFYTLAGFFLLPYFGKNILQDKLGNFLNRKVIIEKISINPYTLTANIESFIIKDKEDKEIFVSAKKIFFNFSLSSLFTFSADISQFSLENPYVNIIQNRDNSFNFSDLIQSDRNQSSDQPSDNSSAKPNDKKILKFSLDNCSIINGKIAYTDKMKNISHTMDDFSFSLPFISSKKKYIKEKSGMDINLELNNTKFDIHIESTPFANNLSTKIDIKTSNIDFIHYLPYFPIPENLKLQSLNFNCELHADYQRNNSDNVLLLDGKIRISNLDLKDSLKKDIINVQGFDVELLESDILDKQLNIAKILITKPQLNLICDKNGEFSFLQTPGLSFKKEDHTKSVSEKNNSFKLNLTDFEIQEGLISFKNNTNEDMINLPKFNIKNCTFDAQNRKINIGAITTGNGNVFVKRQNSNTINLAGTNTPVKELEKSQQMPLKDIRPSSSNETQWDISLTAFDAADFNLQYTDLTNQEPVKIELSKISIKTENIKTVGDKKATIDVQLNWNKNGHISVTGDLIPSKLNSDLNIDFDKIDIKSLQPYFTESIKILVTDGYINTKGKLGIDFKDLKKPKIKFKGDTSVTNFVSLDKKKAKDFFKCNSLYLSDLNVSVFPVKVKIKDISLTDFYSRIIIHDTGKLNVNSIFKSDKKEKSKPRSDSEPPQIVVDNITLQGGHVKFSDYFSKPNYTAKMKDLTGSVTQLSSKPKTRAKVYLKGLHGDSSPLEIIGEINPLTQKKYLDLDFSFKDIELAKFTPYSSKYLGYKIAKGKLILDLEYMIDGNQLKSENRISFDNLTLGERVESEQATSLPVGLAISLLKNSKGQIDLDLPVTGQLDDPEFSIGSIVWKMIANLILKVVTSPFSVIGSMFGGGEELGFIEFEYGKYTITDSNYEKIDKIAQILEAKPSINLEIQGFYDKLKDSEALRIKGFVDLMKAAKLKRMIASGSNAATLDEITIEQQDIEDFVMTAYMAAEFPKPKNETGKEKQLDIEEKKKLLITNAQISNDELRLLAMERSEKIKTYILSTGKVETKRVFLLEPKEDDENNAGLVHFLLK